MTRRKKVTRSPVWDCPVCSRQFLGGPRCAEHNPTPEERATHPELYKRGEFVKHVRDTAA